MNERPVQRPDCRAIRRQACEVGGLSGFESAEFGHCDQQGRGGDVGYAGNAGQDGEAIGEAHVCFDNLENGRFDCPDLAIDLFETLLIRRRLAVRQFSKGRRRYGKPILDTRGAGSTKVRAGRR